jgi:hypothetical protein
MHSAKTAAIAILPTSKQEMDDRKRALVNDVEDLAPSRKRVKDENGAGMRMSDESKEKEVEVSRFHELLPIKSGGRYADSHAGFPERCHIATDERIQTTKEGCGGSVQRIAKENEMA